MKNIYGYVTDASGVSLPGVIVAAAIVPAEANTVTDANGNFSLSVPDTETQLNFYTSFLEGGQPYKTFTIPSNLGGVWNIRLNLVGPVISGGNAPATPDKKKMNWWPVYAGVGLLALLLIRKMSKKKKRK
jgi:hypothetical protein